MRWCQGVAGGSRRAESDAPKNDAPKCELAHAALQPGNLFYHRCRAIGDGGGPATAALLGVSSLDLPRWPWAGGVFYWSIFRKKWEPVFVSKMRHAMCLVARANNVAPTGIGARNLEQVEESPVAQSRMLGASGTFFQCVR